MKVSLVFVTRVLEAIDYATENCNDNGLVYELEKVKNVILQSVSIAKPLISENEKENRWMLEAETLAFDGIEKGRLLGGLSSIKPDILRWLLLITRG